MRSAAGDRPEVPLEPRRSDLPLLAVLAGLYVLVVILLPVAVWKLSRFLGWLASERRISPAIVPAVYGLAVFVELALVLRLRTTWKRIRRLSGHSARSGG